jgi:phosphoribosylformylglycinamidine synthase
MPHLIPARQRLQRAASFALVIEEINHHREHQNTLLSTTMADNAVAATPQSFISPFPAYHPSMRPTTLILRAAGVNCDAETAFAFEQAGSDTQTLHVNRLLENPRLLGRFQILAIPGGFSYGDDIAAGRILAGQLMHHLRDVLHKFVDDGKPVIGICNGFQVLVKTDLLPGPLANRRGQTATLTNNDCQRFVDRWIRLAPRGNRCIWTHGLAPLALPIAHGEGKFVPADESVRQALIDNDQIALVYANSQGAAAGGVFPDNPNGSADDIAGVCDLTGRVFGLMPHPERHIHATQHPNWSNRPADINAEGPGLQIFRNAVNFVEEAIPAGM